MHMLWQVRPSTCVTSPDFMGRLQASHFHSVQTIGQENICAARLVAQQYTSQSSNHPMLILVHGKVTTHVDLIIRSKHKEFSQAMNKVLTPLLK